MIRPKQLWRLLHINRVLIAHGLDELILDVPLFRPLKFLRLFSPNTYKKTEHAARGVRIRKTLEDLGPIFVKFGQTLSTRRDLLPEDIADELALLQDKVPPFAGSLARTIIEAELGKAIEENFTDFDQTPLASASIAQVHTAKLLNGDDVVIKVLRPDIEQRIKGDIALLYDVAELIVRLSDEGQRLRPIEVITEFEKTILDELDMLREAGNASELRRNFETSDMLYIPKIYWDLATRKVLVMERIYGIPVGDTARLKEANIDFKKLAEQGVEIFFTQVFRDNFFHADMHPGNIFISPESNYIAVDFGIVGSLTDADKYYLAENFLAFFNRDYRRVAELHVESGWVHPDSRIDEIESAVRTVCEPIFDKPLDEISYGHLLLRLFQIAQRFKAEVQPQLVLFQKTLLNIEGLGRELYPQLNLWDTAKPFLESWFKKKVNPINTLKKVLEKAPDWSEQIPEFPGLVHRIVDDAAHGRFAVEWRSQELELMRQQMQRNHLRLVCAITGSAFMICSAILILVLPLPASGLGTVGALLMFYAWGIGSSEPSRRPK